MCLTANGNENAKKLYRRLTRDYNKLLRPVNNSTERLIIKLGLKLSQLIGVVSTPLPSPRSRRVMDFRQIHCNPSHYLSHNPSHSLSRNFSHSV